LNYWNITLNSKKMTTNNQIISIIVSYNDVRNTFGTVKTLLDQSKNTKIVVWDNNSSDETVGVLKNHFDNEIIIHESKENLYWTPAINAAIEKYYNQEKYIHWSNNDIIYPNDSLRRMIFDLENISECGMIGPTGSAIGGLQDYIIHQRPKDGDFENFDLFYNHISTKSPTRASSIQGASVIVKDVAYQKVGKLDETMPLGADDFDYSIRIKEAGYSIYVSERSYVNHMGHASGPGNENTWSSLGGQSWDSFNKKWAGYYYNELEALKCMWSHTYTPNWDIGTGWLSEEERIKYWDARKVNYDGQLVYNSIS